MTPKSVSDYLAANREQHLASLCELLRIPSIANVHDQPDSCQRAARWLADYISGLGLEAKILPCQDSADDRPNVLAHYDAGPGKPTLLIYGHYDVQPPDPLDQWKTSPFEPAVRDGKLYARGASDDKGQLFAHLMAIEAWLRAEGRLPLSVKLLFEGQEEIGSPDLPPFIAAHRTLLASDAIVVSDSDWFAPGLPSLTVGLRGIAYFELTVLGPATDIHSGIHGGAVANPVNALASILAAMRDRHGHVRIPGFYDDVEAMTAQERRAWRKLPFDEREYARSLGLSALGGGERRYSALERRWGRPTLDCNGISGGYSGPGAKTIIPSRASAKLSIRLVPRQDPDKIIEGVKQFVAAHTPAGVTVRLSVGHAAAAISLATDTPEMRAARAAVAEVFGVEPALLRCGASVPITELFQKLLGRDAVMMGFGLPDDNLHAPNEKLDLEQLYKGAAASAAFLGKMAGTK